MLERFLGRINLDCRTDGIEKALDPGIDLRSYFSRLSSFSLGARVPDCWFWSKRHCSSVPITVVPISTSQSPKSIVRLTYWGSLSLVSTRIKHNFSFRKAARWGLRSGGVSCLPLWSSDSQLSMFCRSKLPTSAQRTDCSLFLCTISPLHLQLHERQRRDVRRPVYLCCSFSPLSGEREAFLLHKG